MLKVMIVDDEIIVRVGFQSCINWEAHGCQVVSTCESGRPAWNAGPAADGEGGRTGGPASTPRKVTHG